MPTKPRLMRSAGFTSAAQTREDKMNGAAEAMALDLMKTRRERLDFIGSLSEFFRARSSPMLHRAAQPQPNGVRPSSARAIDKVWRRRPAGVPPPEAGEKPG